LSPALFCLLYLCGLGLSYLLKLEPAEPSLNGKIRSFFAAPFVVPVYRAGGFGLTLPPISAFLPFEFVRSALLLIACFPFLLLWKASRGSLIFSLGLAFWVLNGLFGLLQSLGFPPVLCIAHSYVGDRR
jgi:hypothetical protein